MESQYLKWAVNQAFGLYVNALRIEAIRTNNKAAQTYDLYQISMKALEFMGGQNGYDEKTRQVDIPDCDPWEMRRTIVEMAPKWGGEVLGEIVTITAEIPKRVTIPSK
jgi:hypothetical protein